MLMEKRKLSGVGVDIVELRRFKELRFLSRVAEFFLTPVELKEFASHADPISYAASRFALKEAVIKACPEDLTYRDIEITKDWKKPRVKFLGGRSSPGREILVSLSHSTDYVAGFAVAAGSLGAIDFLQAHGMMRK